MKKNFTLITLLISFLALNNTFAQSSKYGWLAQSSWAFGFGGTYPRYISSNLETENELNFGGNLSIQRNFSEHVALRLGVYYLYMEGRDRNPPASNLDLVTNNAISGNLDLLYYFIPCEPVSPYLNVGLGIIHFSVDNEGKPSMNESYPTYQFNAGMGAEWRLAEDWKVKSELIYHTPATSKFDGELSTGQGGLLGGDSDSYITFDIGFVYYFDYGEKSKLCELYEGINRDVVDYNKIEDIVKKYSVEQEKFDYNRIEDIVKKNKTSATGMEDNWVLLGVNFNFNKATLRSESYPVLYNAAEILLLNPETKIEIQGHTDNIGSDTYNQKLSLQRAETVKRFLVAKGVDAKRLSTKGFGESKPIVGNNTPEERELNRRIEFKVTNK